MRKRKLITTIACFILFSSYHLESSVFRAAELSARAATMGGAFVARADDTSAVFYNPAGLAFANGLRLKTNVNYLRHNSSADDPGSLKHYKNNQGQSRAFHFLSLGIKNRISIGLGTFYYNSMETKWPAPWSGRALSVHSKLSTFYIRPVVAIRISKHLAVGAGIDFISSDTTWIYDRIFTFQELGPGHIRIANSESKLSGNAIGFVTSFLVRLNDKVKIGGRYQPKVELDLKGYNNFFFNIGSDPTFLIDREVSSTLTLPQEIALGIMYSPRKNMSLQLDIQWIRMSDMKQWEFSIDPQFYDEFDDYYGIRPDNVRQGIDFNFRNIPRIMFGIEYVLKNSVALRAGYTYQRSAVDNQMIHPVYLDLDTNILSLGVGYEGPAFSIWRSGEKIGGLSLDAYFQYGFSQDIQSKLPEFPAAYKASRWAAGVGIGFNFGSF